MKKAICISLVILAIVSCTSSKKNKLDKFVYDYEQIFNEAQAKKLNDLFKNHEENTGNEIILVTTDDYGDAEGIVKYSDQYVSVNEIGKANNNKSILIVFSDKNSEIKITVESGVKETINDEVEKMIIDSIMLPKFREDKNFEGLWLGSQEIVGLLEKPGSEDNPETEM